MIFDTSEVAPLNRKTTVIPQDQVEAQLALCSQVQAYWHGQGRTPTAYVETYGCQQNEADSQRIRGLLAACGYGFGQGPEGADLVVMNTCAIREHAEQRVFGNLGALTHTKRRHPAQKIFLCGCMAGQPEVEERLRKSFPHVDGVFSTHHLWQFPEILLRVLTTGKRVYYTQDEPGSIAEGLPVRREGHLKAWVSIMYGCNNFCSYCIVPYVRGRERSRRPEAILAECRELIESGYKDITLLGQNVNSYGKDLDCGVDFSDLLAEIAGLPGDFLVRFMTSHPRDAGPKLFDTMARFPKIAKQLHLPVQCGSDRVLNLRRVRLIRVDAHLAHLWVVFDIAYDLRNGTVLVFRYTGLHNVRQHFFIGQHILKHCILAGTSVHSANASGHLRFHGHLPPFHGNILHSYYTCFWLPCQGVCSRFRHKVDTQERIHPV